MVLPEGMSLDIMRDTMVFEYGDSDVVYSNPRIFEYYNGLWFRRNQYIIEGLWKTTAFSYDPIENYNRYEDYEETNDDTENTTRKDTKIDNTSDNFLRNLKDNLVSNNIENESENTSSDTDLSSSAENMVSPYNATTYVEESKTTSTSDTTTTGTRERKDTINKNDDRSVEDTTSRAINQNENYDSTNNFDSDRHKVYSLHAHGNIGVTTTQEMIKQEREIVQFDVYKKVADLWAQDMIIMVW